MASIVIDFIEMFRLHAFYLTNPPDSILCVKPNTTEFSLLEQQEQLEEAVDFSDCCLFIFFDVDVNMIFVNMIVILVSTILAQVCNNHVNR